MLAIADDLVNSGDAYVDGTSSEMINFLRLHKMPSPYSETSIEQNKLLWEKMKNGELCGSVLRLKINYASPNGCLRDPTIYRSISDPHFRTGNSFKVYPTYDFACPIVDAIEGVTHVFRSTEFTDRNPQYKIILDKLHRPCPLLHQYGKLCFQDAVLSKRKIKALIENGSICGWDDPALLTWRGAKRRGLTHTGLIQFLSTIGITKSVVEMEQAALWCINQKSIDKIAIRLVSLDIEKGIVPIKILDQLDILSREIPKFHRNPELGTRVVHYSDTIYMHSTDINTLNVGEEVTLMNWGNAIYQGNNMFKLNLAGDFTKTEKKLRWIAENCTTKIEICQISYENDNVCKHFTYCWIENEIENLKFGDYIQIMTQGYYIIDRLLPEQDCTFHATMSLVELPKV